MKNNQPVTQREQRFSPDEQLISTTDRKGVVLDANAGFIRVSGFSRDELVGKSHNVVRHPDMPQEAFRDLWSTLKQGKPWLGLIKNRCKNGDHYYVEAHVTPIFDEGAVVGYQSVRVAPERTAVDRAERLYADIRRGRSPVWRKLSVANLSLRWRAWGVGLAAALPVLVASYSAGLPLWWALATLVIAGGASWLLVRPVLALATRAREIFSDPLTQLIYTGRLDEVGAIDVVMRAQLAQSRTILGRVSQSADSLADVATQTGVIVSNTTGGVRRQQAEVEQVATAIHEMAATVMEVARTAEETARATGEVQAQTTTGGSLLQRAVDDITQLSQVIAQATRVIEQLQAESESIGSVVDVISKIASETNLLALNAAIEAARAGDQGRGFAVVADEVRNLASNTQQSTEEIQQMIRRVQQTSGEAVKAMQVGQQRANASAELSLEVGEAFEAIQQGVDRISGMNAQVATAAEQQSAVAEEINRSVDGISRVAAETLDHANETSVASATLHQLVGRLQDTVRQFGKV
ncbi:MAG: PAS domain-containing methyl-accepting chemotaxis protein [Spongiibacteraceae bacterium]|jgi:aerotaxis receptor|nr:PAS domain-containing methyl-accepting chemotaxis protein [Spongiibacteraceae bacterium]